MDHFTYRSQMPASASVVYDWHARPGALERLTPPWDRIEVVERTGGLEDGSRVTLSVPVGPARVRWVSRHRDCRPAEGFVDEQVEGPFARWTHAHVMRDANDGTSILEDRIELRAPAGAAGRAVASLLLPQRLAAMFRYRHDTLRADLLDHARHASRPRMTIAMTGARGLVGSALTSFLTTGGHRVIRLVRGDVRGADTARWDPEQGLVDPEALPPLDAVVHLAGEGIAGGRWTAARKAAIRESRVLGTARLAESIARLASPPPRLVCASAIGYYPQEGGNTVTEEDGPGTGFLADVCQAWEAAAAPAIARGLRVVHLRLGLVLSPAGGLLQVLRPLFAAGLGGRLGSGRQILSWMSVDDVVGAFHHALQIEDMSGPVNATAPHAIDNAGFAATLGRVLGRPALLPTPAFAVRLAIGREMADATALSGVRVEPARLLASGYVFRHANVEDALRHVLGRHEEREAR